MGARYLKAEEAVIRKYYSTAPRWKIMELIPDRTWCQIGVKARNMRVLRTSEAKGQAVREGRKVLTSSWGFKDNFLLDRLYPTKTHAELVANFPERTLKAIKSHAHRLHLHRTKEAKAEQIKIGCEEVKAMMERGEYITVKEV